MNIFSPSTFSRGYRHSHSSPRCSACVQHLVFSCWMRCCSTGFDGHAACTWNYCSVLEEHAVSCIPCTYIGRTSILICTFNSIIKTILDFEYIITLSVFDAYIICIQQCSEYLFLLSSSIYIRSHWCLQWSLRMYTYCDTV